MCIRNAGSEAGILQTNMEEMERIIPYLLLLASDGQWRPVMHSVACNIPTNPKETIHIPMHTNPRDRENLTSS